MFRTAAPVCTRGLRRFVGVIFLGGSSIGKGFKKAAKTYLKRQEEAEADAADQQQQSQGDFDPEDAFYVVDLGVLVSQVYQWRKFFPRVEPFYAVKCNPDSTGIWSWA